MRLRSTLLLVAAAGAATPLVAFGTATAGAPARVSATDPGSGHLPAYHGPERPALANALPASTASPAPEAPATPTASVPTFTAAPAPTPATTAPAPPTASVALGVTQRELPHYATQLSRTTVPAGDVTIQLQNSGEDPHNLRIERTDGTGTATDFSDTAPGANATRTVELAPGTYRFFCTLPGHAAAGMDSTLTVTG